MVAQASLKQRGVELAFALTVLGTAVLAVAVISLWRPIEAWPPIEAFRVPQGWKALDPTPGADGWAKRARDPSTGIVFILVKPGRFMMGSPDGEGLPHEHPQHKVQITRPFYLAETETTVAQWRRFSTEGAYAYHESENHPVGGVNWDDAKAFCKHYGYRLPTEAEWEYACRAGSQTAFSFGNEEAKLLDYGWFFRNSGKTLLPEDTLWNMDRLCEWGCQVQPVKGKKPNAFGLYDMHGNISEWCEYGERDYTEDAQVDPVGPADTTSLGLRGVRGGSFFYLAYYSRSASRHFGTPSLRFALHGFRPAKSVES